MEDPQSTKYKVYGHKIIDGYHYGYVKTINDQSFYAIADGWEAICGMSRGLNCWVFIRKLDEKETTIKELEEELEEAKEKVKRLKKQIENKISNRFEIMDLRESGEDDAC